MDGLSISTANQLLTTGKTVSQIRADEMKAESGVPVEQKSFKQTLTDAISDVNNIQKKSDILIQKLATGETKNIPEVMIAVEKADIAMKLMTQVRNKIIDAYQEVIKMPV